MYEYKKALKHIINNGVYKGDRTGTGTLSVFGYQMRFPLSEGFPIVTAKFTPFKLIATELLWFLKGNPDISFLHDNNCHIWDEWVKSDGTFGPIYGKQWRSWPDYRILLDNDEKDIKSLKRGYQVTGLEYESPEGSVTAYLCKRDIDQIANVIRTLKTNPDDRRMIVSAWNVADVEYGDMALPPCHVLFQFYSAPGPTEGGKRVLSCQLYQRSCDIFLGVPFNIASYALLTHMIAQVTDHYVGDFIWTGGDVHLYTNHEQQAKTYLEQPMHLLPTLALSQDIIHIDDFTLSDMALVGYEHSGSIKAPVAV